MIFYKRYRDKGKMQREIDGLNPRDMRSPRADASGALGLGRQMLSYYFNRRDDAASALIFITDSPSTDNVDLIVRILLNILFALRIDTVIQI